MQIVVVSFSQILREINTNTNDVFEPLCERLWRRLPDRLDAHRCALG